VSVGLATLTAVPAEAQAGGKLARRGAPPAHVEEGAATRATRIGFPYGLETFDGLEAGQMITAIQGWELVASPADLNVCGEGDSVAMPPNSSPTWLHVEDLDPLPRAVGFDSPVVEATGPWNYRFGFLINIGAAPAAGSHASLFIAHDGDLGFDAAWGIRFDHFGARLFVTDLGGTAHEVPLAGMMPLTLDQWFRVDVDVRLSENKLVASIDGGAPVSIGINPGDGFDASTLRFSYRSQGANNLMRFSLDDVGVIFSKPDCRECVNIDFEMDDSGNVLFNGQDISSAEEFGTYMTIDSIDGLGAAIFDSDPGGPNDPSQDLDLLVGLGNMLIIQNLNVPEQTIPGIFDLPNDEDEGGVIDFAFVNPIQPLNIDLADLCIALGEGVTLTLTDDLGAQRVYSVPAGWTEDLVADGGPGYRTLDLTSLAPQPGFMTVATGAEDPGYDGDAVVAMSIDIFSSAAVDNFSFCIPCFTLDFETEDDGVTPLVDGQALSTPPEFGVLVSLTSLPGPNLGAALFDSTPGGPNDPSQDTDLLVGLGNLLINQNNNAPQMSVPDIFDFPNDDADGGSTRWDFLSPATPLRVDIVDLEDSPGQTCTVLLTDINGNTRTYFCPQGFTGEVPATPPGFTTLDLTTLADQPGEVNPATATEDPGYDGSQVVSIQFTFSGSGAYDNLCFCP